MEETNVFCAKTVDEAIEEGLKALNLTLDEAEITILENGKKKLFGAVKAKVQIMKKRSDAKRAAEFIDGLMNVMGINAVSEIVSEDDNIVIDIKTTKSALVIGKHGDLLDSVQCLAGAIANIGRDDYKKVVVDCENYRGQREETLKSLADKLAKKAIETGRKVILEPMSPYERRIIHSALSENKQVKTVSEGKEPARYIAVIPEGAKPYDKGIKYGERHDRRGGRDDRRDRNFRGGRDGKFDRGDRGDRPRRSAPSGGGAKRGKKEIHFGTFLGNSKNMTAEPAPENNDNNNNEE